MSYRDINLQVMNKLSEFGAKNIKDTPMGGQSRDKNQKIRYLFEIDEREQALACYQFFNRHYSYVRQLRGNKYNKKEDKKESESDKNKDEAGSEFAEMESSEFNLKELMKIYLQKEEHVFVQYADVEAELYE
jgi:hypothetical protein